MFEMRGVDLLSAIFLLRRGAALRNTPCVVSILGKKKNFLDSTVVGSNKFAMWGPDRKSMDVRPSHLLTGVGIRL